MIDEILPSKGHVGIFGPTECGKTTLARALFSAYGSAGIPGIVLDINNEEWSENCIVTADTDEFLDLIENSTGCAVFADEIGETLARNPYYANLFTRIRHNKHKMHCAGHDAASLLPVQRRQLLTLFLFCGTVESCRLFATDIPNIDLTAVPTLRDYEFMRVRRGEIPRKYKLAL